MKKVKLIFFALIAGIISINAQTFSEVKANRVIVSNVLKPNLDTIILNVRDSGAIAYKNGALYTWNGYKWNQSTRGGSGTVTSVDAGWGATALPAPITTSGWIGVDSFSVTSWARHKKSLDSLAASMTASNGLTKLGSNFVLGGTLAANTTLSGLTNTFTYSTTNFGSFEYGNSGFKLGYTGMGVYSTILDGGVSGLTGGRFETYHPTGSSGINFKVLSDSIGQSILFSNGTVDGAGKSASVIAEAGIIKLIASDSIKLSQSGNESVGKKISYASNIEINSPVQLTHKRYVDSVVAAGSQTVYDPDLTMLNHLGAALKSQNFPINIQSTSSVKALLDARVEYYAINIYEAATITGVKWIQAISGVYTGNEYNGVGLYTYSGGTLTLVASSTNDANLWTVSTNSLGSKDFTTPYSAAAGIYYVGLLYNQSAQTTAPTIGSKLGHNIGATGLFTNSASIAMTQNTQTEFPSSVATTSLTATNSYGWVALY